MTACVPFVSFSMFHVTGQNSMQFIVRVILVGKE